MIASLTETVTKWRRGKKSLRDWGDKILPILSFCPKISTFNYQLSRAFLSNINLTASAPLWIMHYELCINFAFPRENSLFFCSYVPKKNAVSAREVKRKIKNNDRVVQKTAHICVIFAWDLLTLQEILQKYDRRN